MTRREFGRRFGQDPALVDGVFLHPTRTGRRPDGAAMPAYFGMATATTGTRAARDGLCSA